MSCLSLGKKLRPAKKAWKGFTSNLQRKLHKLKRSKAIKKTTSHLNNTLAVVLIRSPSFPSRLLHRKTKKRVIAGSSPFKQHKHHSHKQKFAPVYVDELFTVEPISLQAKHLEAPTAATAMTVQQLNKVETKVSTTPALAETSKAAGDRGTASAVLHGPPKGSSGQSVVDMEVPQLRGVDERAEEFIAKFKEEMRLQRQKSLGEYQEMLARGV